MTVQEYALLTLFRVRKYNLTMDIMIVLMMITGLYRIFCIINADDVFLPLSNDHPKTDYPDLYSCGNAKNHVAALDNALQR